MKMRLIVPAIIVFALCLASCGRASSSRPYNDGSVLREDMELDRYYVKDGTRFYLPLVPSGTTAAFRAAASPDPVGRFLLLLPEEMEKIPVLYLDEAVCFKSVKTDAPTMIRVERYKYLGTSIGTANLSMDTERVAYAVDLRSVKAGSSLDTYIGSIADLRSIYIQYADGEFPLDLYKCGAISTDKKSLKVQFQYGTFVTTADILADTSVLVSSECFPIGDVKSTSNGYVRISMPVWAEEGYYYIENGGLIRYVPERRVRARPDGDPNIRNMDTSVTYAVDDTIVETVFDYVFVTEEDLEGLSVRIQASSPQHYLTSCAIISPDGRREDLDPLAREIRFDWAGAPKGEYVVHLTGYNPDLTAISVTEDHRSEPPPEAAPSSAPEEEMEEAEEEMEEESKEEAGDISGEEAASETESAPLDTPAPQAPYEYYENTYDEPIRSGTVRG